MNTLLIKRTPPPSLPSLPSSLPSKNLNILLNSKNYHTKSKRRTDPTPPSWYKQNCLMYGEYTVEKQRVKPSYLKASNKTILREPSALKLKTDEPPAHWLMNPQEEELYSQILQKKVRVRVSKEALRMIDYCGGLDEYILFNRDRMGAGGIGKELYDIMIKKMEEKNLLLIGVNSKEKKMTSSVEMLNDKRIIREGFRGNC